jgi:pimeloyl-ACP methyl ester carboxylesterase
LWISFTLNEFSLLPIEGSCFNIAKTGHTKWEKQMQSTRRQPLKMSVQNAEVGSHQHGYYPVKLTTPQGIVHCRHYRIEAAKKAAIWVGGIGGNWDTPARELYPQLCQDLMHEGVTSLRVRFRHSTDLEESVLDVLAGISYLEDAGVEAIALIGHSFGGAVVIQTAVQSEAVCAVVTLATQSYGTSAVPELASRCSLLLLHGVADPILSPLCSRYVYNLALEPKRLVFYPDATHGLDEVADEVHQMMRVWIVEQLILPRGDDSQN